MSLYGTGRKEGIFAACFIGILTAGAHLAALLRNDSMHEAAYVTMFAGAIGGMLAYRFLRAQGRSRYAAFLGGIAYGMSPLFAGLMDSPREQLAAAFAPLTLEAAAQCSRPTTRRRWLPWVGVSLAIPFTFGVTVIAILGSGLALSMVTMNLVHCGRGDERTPLLTAAISLALGATCLLNVAWLDPLGAWLGMHQTADLQRVLSGETTPMVILRAIGPFLVWFALLGILRRQRHIARARGQGGTARRRRGREPCDPPLWGDPQDCAHDVAAARLRPGLRAGPARRAGGRRRRVGHQHRAVPPLPLRLRERAQPHSAHAPKGLTLLAHTPQRRQSAARAGGPGPRGQPRRAGPAAAAPDGAAPRRAPCARHAARRYGSARTVFVLVLGSRVVSAAEAPTG